MISVARPLSWRIPAGTFLLAAFMAFLPTQPGVAGRAPPRIGVFGDSISAGEGLPDIHPGEDGCQRALGRDGRSTAWGVQVSRAIETKLSAGRSWFAACTGAQTEHFARDAQRGNGRDKAQLAEARDGAGPQDFDVLLGTFGINDMASGERLLLVVSGMSAVLANCIGVDESLTGAAGGITGGWIGGVAGGAIGLAVGRCRPDLDPTIRAHLDSEVRAELRTLYEEMYEATAPTALIVLPSYPQFITHPDRWPMINKATRRCQLVHRDDAHIIRGLLARLNQIIREEVDAAARLHPDRQWTSVDVVSKFDDHGLCSPSGQQWLNGLTLTPRPQRSFHPTQDGQNAYNDAVMADGEVAKWIAASTSGRPTGTLGSGVAGGTIKPTESLGSGESSTSIVIDTSSSMEEIDTDGSPRIDGAKRAATDLLTLVGSGVTGKTDMGLVGFSNVAVELAPVGSDVATLRSQISAMQPSARTNLGDGLQLGIRQLSGRSGAKSIVLLSDGATNEGLSRDQILSQLVPAATSAGIKVYTVGFGEAASDFDEALLRQIADGTGGEYGAAQAAAGLRQVFQLSHYQSIGTVVANVNGAVAQGQVRNAGNFLVEPLKEQLHVALSWPGSDLDPVLIDPNGKTVDERYKGVRFFRDQNPEVVVIDRPKDGEWTLKVKGKEVSEPEEEFFAIAATRGQVAPDPATSMLLPFLIGGSGLALGGAGGGYAVFRTRRRRTGTCSRCGAPHDGRRPCANCGRRAMMSLDLMVLDGPQAGQVLRLQPGDVLGRGEAASHVLYDETVSRAHAEIAWTEGQWAIFDLGSSLGTFRNREPVVRAHLNVGDIVTLGSTNLRVEGTTT